MAKGLGLAKGRRRGEPGSDPDNPKGDWIDDRGVDGEYNGDKSWGEKGYNNRHELYRKGDVFGPGGTIRARTEGVGYGGPQQAARRRAMRKRRERRPPEQDGPRDYSGSPWWKYE